MLRTPFFTPGMTAGRGGIALALVVIASWRPGRLLAGRDATSASTSFLSGPLHRALTRGILSVTATTAKEKCRSRNLSLPRLFFDVTN
jgi:hypothetical protein